MMDNVQELREIVNPVFNTAKSCIQLDAATGDEDSRQLLGALGFGGFADQKDNKRVPAELAEKVKRLFPIYTVLTDSRFQIVNNVTAGIQDSLKAGAFFLLFRLHRGNRDRDPAQLLNVGLRLGGETEPVQIHEVFNLPKLVAGESVPG